MIKFICKNCKKVLWGYKSDNRKFCSQKCHCNYLPYKEKVKKRVSKQQRKMWANPIYRKHMSDVHKGKYAGENHPNWNGGRHKTVRNYILIYKPNHPFAVRQYVKEHRFVMEQFLDRFLEPQEVVHHINGDVTDNRIENLKLFANDSEHKKFHHPKGKKFSKIIHI